jgi:hypothetical protein
LQRLREPDDEHIVFHLRKTPSEGMKGPVNKRSFLHNYLISRQGVQRMKVTLRKDRKSASSTLKPYSMVVARFEIRRLRRATVINIQVTTLQGFGAGDAHFRIFLLIEPGCRGRRKPSYMSSSLVLTLHREVYSVRVVWQGVHRSVSERYSFLQGNKQ